MWFNLCYIVVVLSLIVLNQSCRVSLLLVVLVVCNCFVILLHIWHVSSSCGVHVQYMIIIIVVIVIIKVIIISFLFYMSYVSCYFVSVDECNVNMSDSFPLVNWDLVTVCACVYIISISDCLSLSLSLSFCLSCFCVSHPYSSSPSPSSLPSLSFTSHIAFIHSFVTDYCVCVYSVDK